MTSSARISVSSSSSDEPQFISRSSSQAALAARPNPRKARSSVKEIEGEGDGETLASEESSMQGFAQKYKYKGAGSPSGTALRKTQSRDDALGGESRGSLRSKTQPPQKISKVSSRTRSVKRTATMPLPILLPDSTPVPSPVPNWLGRPAVLLKLKDCPVCRTRWKGKESGISRWKHISTCRPPLYRSPNAPPDLQTMIHEALSARSMSSTLLELHAGSVTQAENTVAHQQIALDWPKGLASVTSVKASDSRGNAWDDEVHERVQSWIGRSSPPPFDKQSTSAQYAKSLSPSGYHPNTSPSDAGDVQYVATQPMGVSDLAQRYLKQRPSSPAKNSTISEELSVPPSNDSEILIPASDSDEDEELGDQNPFQLGEACVTREASPNLSGQTDELLDGAATSAFRAGEAAFASLDDDVERETQHSSGAAITGLDVKKKSKGALGSPKGVHSRLSHLSIVPEAGSLIGLGVSPSSTLKSAQMPSVLFTPSLKRVMTPVRPCTRSPDDTDTFGYEDDDPGAILSWEPQASEEGLASDLDTPYQQAEQSDSKDEFTVGIVDPNCHDDEAETRLFTSGVEERLLPVPVGDSMPDYECWDVKKLQRLTTEYGYRPVKDHAVLVRLATECWKALNTDPQLPSSSTGFLSDAPTVAAESDDQMGENAQVERLQASKKVKKKARTLEVDLHQVWYGVIKEDSDLYLRVLRYEPISLEELISKSIRVGIDNKGWKIHLKRFLDSQSITFFTRDTTKQHHRH